ncbi:hypothetical protein NDU88_003050 [Pleurodeles waltl]|uniref:Uncharacterized protein n=1 Tax=Pleurodeles waltl TaxID=8319 RepID=A0AAV7UZH9_PLEWA|nr:hypothetical protein NDU88_003050 [Pleurodeles waltl]
MLQPKELSDHSAACSLSHWEISRFIPRRWGWLTRSSLSASSGFRLQAAADAGFPSCRAPPLHARSHGILLVVSPRGAPHPLSDQGTTATATRLTWPPGTFSPAICYSKRRVTAVSHSDPGPASFSRTTHSPAPESPKTALVTYSRGPYRPHTIVGHLQFPEGYGCYG